MLAVIYNHSSQETTSFTEKLFWRLFFFEWSMNCLKLEPNQHYWFFKIFILHIMFFLLLKKVKNCIVSRRCVRRSPNLLHCHFEILIGGETDITFISKLLFLELSLRIYLVLIYTGKRYPWRSENGCLVWKINTI